MPWTTADVDSFKKGLTTGQKRRWVEVANATLESCMKKGGTEKRCAARAVRTANSLFSEAATLARFTLSDPLELVLQEAQILGADEYQLVLPIGTWHSLYYGRIEITPEVVRQLVQHYQERVLGERDPFIDTDHDNGAANGWIRDLEAREDGLYAKIEWTDRGRRLIEGKEYRYFSAHIAEVVDIHTGEKVYPVLIATALTNTPVMNTMPAAHLSNKAASATDRDGGTNHREGTMTLQEILDALKALDGDALGTVTDEQRSFVMERFGIEIPSGKTETELSDLRGKLKFANEREGALREELKVKSTELAELKDKRLRETCKAVIDKAVEDGKVTAKTRDKWEKLYLSDPEQTVAILEDLGPTVDLSERGSGNVGKGEAHDQDITAAERAVHEAMGHSEDDVKKFGGNFAPDMIAKAKGE